MTTDEKLGEAGVYPFLRYADAPKALRWLCDAFGFTEEACHPGPKGTIAHAVVRLGEGRVLLSSARPDDILGMKTVSEAGAATQGIYVRVPDVDAHFERARSRGADIAYPLTDQDYGSREYGARDPEGNVWSFGTYRPGS